MSLKFIAVVFILFWSIGLKGNIKSRRPKWSTSELSMAAGITHSWMTSWCNKVFHHRNRPQLTFIMYLQEWITSRTHPINETIDLWYPIQNIYSRLASRFQLWNKILLISFGGLECCIKDSEVTSVMDDKEGCWQMKLMADPRLFRY